uniref:Nuclear receptor-binding factor 2 MIT domain-containing protein n=1 Tax=Strigamia maritima TaxID=126957 RepID=T1IIW5_STRMM
MEYMESSLNAAHYQHRKAQNYMRLGKFDQAVGHHQRAAELLKDAMQMTKSDKALESLRLQHDYHVRQEAVVRFKQQEAERLLRRIQKKKLHEIERGDSEQTVFLSSEGATGDLQHAIYRTLEETDSLLAFLIQNKQQSQAETQEIRSNGAATAIEDQTINRGWKIPKDDKTLMEELKTNNSELKKLVQRLLNELDKCHEEKQQLQDMLDNIQMMNDITSSSNPSSRASSKMAHLRVATDSSSPFVLSPSGELSPVELPPLAPLEMPNFDFNLLDPKSN